jgi:hypothetical protein
MNITHGRSNITSICDEFKNLIVSHGIDNLKENSVKLGCGLMEKNGLTRNLNT